MKKHDYELFDNIESEFEDYSQTHPRNQKPQVDMSKFWCDQDGYVLAGAVISALSKAERKDLASAYIKELMKTAFTYKQCVEVSRKYVILKNMP